MFRIRGDMFWVGFADDERKPAIALPFDSYTVCSRSLGTGEASGEHQVDDDLWFAVRSIAFGLYPSESYNNFGL